MADDPQHSASANANAEANRQRPDTAPNDHARAEDQPGKLRTRRPKLSLRYRPQAFAADL